MPDVILRILSIIGIILLILLGMVLVSLLIVLFWPVTYRVKGEKGTEKLWIMAKADWLFGVLRVRYAYPEPGSVVIKLLWKTLLDTGQQEKASGEEPEAGEHAEEKVPAEIDVSEESDETEGGTGDTEPEADVSEEGNPEEAEASAQAKDTEPEEKTALPESTEPEKKNLFSRVFEKIQKIKYTILKIYDKIKGIWANISYYIALLREEDTALLWKHVKLRLGKILKNIRPRHIRANVLFGTGAPDTTGYAFGIYGMLLPVLGKNVCVTPDFNRKILEGNMDVSGHITIWTLVWNTLKLLLDKKLKLFIKKMKAGRKENGR